MGSPDASLTVLYTWHRKLTLDKYFSMDSAFSLSLSGREEEKGSINFTKLEEFMIFVLNILNCYY